MQIRKKEIEMADIEYENELLKHKLNAKNREIVKLTEELKVNQINIQAKELLVRELNKNIKNRKNSAMDLQEKVGNHTKVVTKLKERDKISKFLREKMEEKNKLLVELNFQLNAVQQENLLLRNAVEDLQKQKTGSTELIKKLHFDLEQLNKQAEDLEELKGLNKNLNDELDDELNEKSFSLRNF